MARWLTLAACLTLFACGGGGGGGDPAPSGSDWVAGQFLPSAQHAARCEAPRSGTDPWTGSAFADIKGRTLDENNWLRSWSHELYLWYNEIVDRDPGLYSDPLDYFARLKTNALTPSGNAKDRFHFTYDSQEWFDLSVSGISAGYGVTFAFPSSVTLEVVVAYTEPGSPAVAAGLSRGARIIAVDGITLATASGQSSIDLISEALFPSALGDLHVFEVLDLGANATRAIELVSQEVVSAPVQNVGAVTSPAGAVVGYMLFNDHLATAEQALVDAVSALDAQGIEDLVIDIRYNGGGFLYIASELAYMVAGSAAEGYAFEQLEFNDQHPTTNPVTGAALAPVPFYNAYQVDANSPILPLPSLDLSRVFVLTSRSTCSASESIINGLRGVGVEVIQIGSPTCGKPYGFYPQDNCGTTYFTIQFRGVNAQGFGDYADGFSPSGSTSSTETRLPGCSVGDDFNHALGQPDEARLATALRFRDTSVCTSPEILSNSRDNTLSSTNDTALLGEAKVYKSPWLMNRIMRE